MPQVVSLGEVMLRLSPFNASTIETAHQFNVYAAGAESNVAVALARLGVDTGFVTKLTDNSVGRLICNRIRENGVDVNQVIWTDKGRNSAYYVENGVKPRPVRIVYDREHSAFTTLTEAEIDWKYLTGSKVVHLSGITPALGKGNQRLVKEIIKRATRNGAKVTFDINFRKKLWSAHRARGALSELISGVHVLICSANDAQVVFKIETKNPDSAVEALMTLSKSEVVVMTMKERGAMAYDGQRILFEPAIESQTVDRIGRGDAFAAGFIYGYLENDVQKGLRYGNTMAALQQTTLGDQFCFDRQMVRRLVSNRLIETDR